MIRSILVVIMTLFASTLRAEESATSLAKKLEAQIFSTPAVSMSFKSSTEGKVTVKADLKNKRIRLETSKMLLISDGKTIWNINKLTKRVTIDGVSDHSAFRDPAALFRFSSNYLAQLNAHTGTSYTLDLIPSKDIAAVFQQAGANQRLRVTMKLSGKSVKVLGAKAISLTGQSATGPVAIAQLRSTKSSDFEFQRTASMSIIDLRE
jgi:outer membrane lipoprotein-sorting protein